MEYLAKKLMDLMAKTATTQQILSKKIRISQPTISDYLNRKAYPKLDVLLKLSEYFKVSLYELTGLERLKGIEDQPEPDLTDEDREIMTEYKKLPDNDWRKKAIENILLGKNDK